MTYKSTMCYVMLRSMGEDDNDPIPVAVFTDFEVASGNTEGYNLSMKEQGVEGITFYLRTTMMYE